MLQSYYSKLLVEEFSDLVVILAYRTFQTQFTCLRLQQWTCPHHKLLPFTIPTASPSSLQLHCCTSKLHHWTPPVK